MIVRDTSKDGVAVNIEAPNDAMGAAVFHLESDSDGIDTNYLCISSHNRSCSFSAPVEYPVPNPVFASIVAEVSSRF